MKTGLATVRAPRWINAGVNMPTISYKFAIIRSSPCEAVNGVSSATAATRPWFVFQFGFKRSDWRFPLVDASGNKLDPPNQLRAAY